MLFDKRNEKKQNSERNQKSQLKVEGNTEREKSNKQGSIGNSGFGSKLSLE